MEFHPISSSERLRAPSHTSFKTHLDQLQSNKPGANLFSKISTKKLMHTNFRLGMKFITLTIANCKQNISFS